MIGEIEFKLDSLTLINLPIGCKKRLQEIEKENGVLRDQKFIEEYQALFDRLRTDLNKVRDWNNISIEMMLNRCSKLIRQFHWKK